MLIGKGQRRQKHSRPYALARQKTSGSERRFLPFDGEWLMTEGVSPELDNTKSGGR
ncbi:hypothetical protein JOC77_000641 [Peribacillus deserti]|uniref:Uncharacterized protein n=1 Tax=Peribacillus deserti TaxID=673318 RepID=A0ABS2QDK3_9BACI|nr:hypothetical protein [Peribacillus deserti]